ncbi:transglutaminase family protein [Paroceanicella profunda]|uniref:transglutaminase family protein n=1 Tax=Paroceanicella profunda TaxID=2579971 RepID=UPI001EF0FC13|nr:transglutaminase family protein [Paroceanicella profunda]
MIDIRHRTTYRYSRPVGFGPHHLILRPREGHELHIRSFALTCEPAGALRWASDVFGNAIATLLPEGRHLGLMIETRVRVVSNATAWPVFGIDTAALRYPFRYDDAALTDLGSLLRPAHADPEGRLLAWSRGFVADTPGGTDTLSLLRDLCAGVSAAAAYRRREEHGTQAPLETLHLGTGTCRDMATLLAEACRQLGLGARLVSGYLLPDAPSVPRDSGVRGTGATHAWVEVFLPGAGWIAFDPTNHRAGRGLGGARLVPVAAVREIRHAVPVSGSFFGSSDALDEMTVEVDVVALEDEAPAWALPPL